MAVTNQSVTYFNFSGGLNTDASPLNRKPEEATEMLNMDLGVDGSLSPRKGLDFIGTSGYTTSTFDYTSAFGNFVQEVPSVAVFKPTTSAGVVFTVVVSHIADQIHIYDYTTLSDLGDGSAVRQTIDLSFSSGKQAHRKTQFQQDRNRLFMVNNEVTFGFLEFNQDTSDFSFVLADVFVRDLKGDASADSFVRHNSKTYSCIKSHTSSDTNEPGEGTDWENFWVMRSGIDSNYTDAWSVGTTGASKVTISFVDDFGGGSATGYTEYTCIADHTSDATNKPGSGANWTDYWTSNGIVTNNGGITKEPPYPAWASGSSYIIAVAENYTSNVVALRGGSTEPLGWNSLVMSAGRLWVAGSPQEHNTVYFSQSLFSDGDLGFNRMYQYADPLNSLDSVAVDTDGGSIRITGAINIKALMDFRGGVLVFAENGVWFVRGSNGVFLATDFSVDKISSDGLVSASGVVAIEDAIVYFGLSNVYVIALKDVDISPSTTVISTKIKELYNSISLASKRSSQAVYEPTSKKIYLGTNFDFPSWMILTNPERQPTMFRDFLIFDTRLQSWYKHSLTDDTDGSKVAVGTMFIVDGGDTDFAKVVDELGNQVVDALGNDVIAANPEDADLSTVLSTLLLKKNGDNVDFAFGVYTGKSTSDFSKNAVDTVTYDSTARMAHQVLGDVVHNKQSPYVTTIFERIEDFVDDGAGDDTNPGGCLMRLSYNFATGDKSQKYGTQFQAYKPTKWSISYFGGTDPNVEVVQNKHKVRGRGAALQVEISNDPGKDFKLYGYQIEYSASRKV